MLRKLFLCYSIVYYCNGAQGMSSSYRSAGSGFYLAWFKIKIVKFTPRKEKVFLNCHSIAQLHVEI